jgi:hypothetical protein
VATVYRTLFIGLGAAPAAPTWVSPTNAALLNDSTPIYQWTAVTPPSGVTLTDYELQVANNSCGGYITDPPVIVPVTASTGVSMHWKNEKPDL